MGDELDALGPIALDVLSRHGVHWPPNVHTFELLLEPAKGGALVTGNGGDELLFPWAGHRVALIRRGKALPRRRDVRPLMRSFLPAPLLFQWAMRRPWFQLPWLRPAAARELARGYAAHSMPIGSSWQRELDEYLDSRYLEVGLRLTAALAEDADVELVEPFFDATYIRAVGADAPSEGYATRTAVMRRYFGDLLPSTVPRRSTKAVFTEVFSGPATRRFAERWTGVGVDPELVEWEALRDEWLSPIPDLRSLVPLQAAWLASG